MGTRFMASRESPLHPKIKEMLRQTGETGTLVSERSIRNAARVIKTDFSLKVLEMEAKGATLEELYPLLKGTRGKQSYINGGTNDAILHCGQVIGLIDDIPSVKEIIDGIINGAELICQRLNKLRGSA